MARKKATREEIAAKRKQQAEVLHASIIDQVEALRGSGEWLRFLHFVQSFHRYSINNLLLIMGQRPEATRVAGFRKWQEMGRQVRKGERAIRIFGYATKLITEEDDNGQKVTRKIAYYPMVNVFDISQTDSIDGQEPPRLSEPLSGDDPGMIYVKVVQYLQELGWTTERKAINGPANGYTTLTGDYRVVVDSTLSDAQAAKTALHEAAHVIMHTEEGKPHADGLAREVKETEAESVAYIVAGLLGLDTSAYSVGYIGGWAQCDTAVIKDTATRVLEAANTLTDALDKLAASETEVLTA